MGLRPGKCYRGHQRAYTRVATHVPRKSYVKGVPKGKIAEFEGGTKANYTNVIFLVAKRNVQIRHNALESARVTAIQLLEKGMGKGDTFFFKIRVYPHQILRENAMATGAGADRFQTGMRQSFGKPISTAAVVRKGQIIAEIRVKKQHVNVARKAFKQATYKLFPCS